MSIKDKLEIGLKPDAPYRPDNLPEFQQHDPACEEAADPGTGPKQQAAREECTDGDKTVPRDRRITPPRTDGVPDE
jgi:hypothetical protein